ncbi:MAG: glutamate formimidoyltransferase [Taibaiella sp.]|nr:glutamate formimidoyltransferase [Taibaiella sp.]
MHTTSRILECVPNFSEGRDSKTINAIADVIRTVNGVHLLHIDSSAAANRTVMTFAGAPDAVTEAAFRAIRTASELIDMRQQEGIHPRIGATDVCPLIPLSGITMEEAVDYSRQLGERVGKELNIPVYLYEYSAIAVHRRALPDIRKGQYEGLAEKMKLPEWIPDYGKDYNATKGATVIGARDILVAFNISLNSKNIEHAQFIALRIRERGYIDKNDGESKHITGLLDKVRAIGWYTQDFNTAQVSMNLLDYRITSPLKAWETCNTLANNEGVTLRGCELVGLIPEVCLIEAGTYAYLREREEVPQDKLLLVHSGAEYLGLANIKPFDPQQQVLEYALHHAGLL